MFLKIENDNNYLNILDKENYSLNIKKLYFDLTDYSYGTINSRLIRFLKDLIIDIYYEDYCKGAKNG
jgi:hypothetical protein